MSRPKTDTIDYFSHDCDASTRKTLTIMRGQFGLAGVGFWWSLLEHLGRSEGHVHDVRDSSDLEFLLQQLGTDLISGTEMLDKLAFLGAIDKILWHHRVIWSQNFVDRLADVYKKRNRDVPQKPCFCTENCNHPIVEPGISGTETGVSVTETGVFGAEMPQSKVNHSIVNKKEKYIKRKYGEFQNVLLTDDEYQKLKERFNTKIDSMIEGLSAYIASKGKKYKSHYATLLNWHTRGRKEKDGKTRHSRDLPEKYTEIEYND